MPNEFVFHFILIPFELVESFMCKRENFAAVLFFRLQSHYQVFNQMVLSSQFNTKRRPSIRSLSFSLGSRLVVKLWLLKLANLKLALVNTFVRFRLHTNQSFLNETPYRS